MKILEHSGSFYGTFAYKHIRLSNPSKMAVVSAVTGCQAVSSSPLKNRIIQMHACIANFEVTYWSLQNKCFWYQKSACWTARLCSSVISYASIYVDKLDLGKGHRMGSCLFHVPRVLEHEWSSLNNSDLTMPSGNTSNILSPACKPALLQLFRRQILRPDRLTNKVLLD